MSTTPGLPQHVWVSIDGRWHERHPGLLVEWRRRRPGGDWEAFVIWAAGGGNVAWGARQQWLRRDQVRALDEHDEIRPRAPGEG